VFKRDKGLRARPRAPNRCEIWQSRAIAQLARTCKAHTAIHLAHRAQLRSAISLHLPAQRSATEEGGRNRSEKYDTKVMIADKSVQNPQGLVESPYVPSCRYARKYRQLTIIRVSREVNRELASAVSRVTRVRSTCARRNCRAYSSTLRDYPRIDAIPWRR